MARRKAPNGSGMLPKLRADGRWEARYTFRDPITGQNKRRSVYAKSQEECAKQLRKATAQIDDGSYTEPSKLTVKKWAEIWKSEYWGNLKERTADQYAMHIRLNINPYIGSVPLLALSPHNIQAMYNKLLQGGKDGRVLSPKSIKNLHGIVHSMLKQAQLLGYIKSNPAEACTLPRVEKKEMQVLKDESLELFLEAIKGHRYESVYLVSVFTGMRQGEVLGLVWEDVDFNKGIIHVRRQLQKERRVGGIYKRVPLKNDKPRLISPAPFVMEVLKRVDLDQKARKLQAGALWQNEMNLVFTNEMGKNLATVTVYNNFKAIITGLGLEGVRMHDLRHPYVKPTTKKLSLPTRGRTLDFTGFFCFFFTFSRKEVA